jgi:hypothetical protein
MKVESVPECEATVPFFCWNAFLSFRNAFYFHPNAFFLKKKAFTFSERVGIFNIFHWVVTLQHTLLPTLYQYFAAVAMPFTHMIR